MSAKYTFLAWDTPIENAPLKLALLQLMTGLVIIQYPKWRFHAG